MAVALAPLDRNRRRQRQLRTRRRNWLMALAMASMIIWTLRRREWEAESALEQIRRRFYCNCNQNHQKPRGFYS